MPFLIQCDNHKCYKLQEARLEVETDQVICAECGEPIQSVTVFAKRQLKSLGQTTKLGKAKQTYSIKCKHCATEDVPQLSPEDTFVCSKCNQELNLSYPFKVMLRNAMKNEAKPSSSDR